MSNRLKNVTCKQVKNRNANESIQSKSINSQKTNGDKSRKRYECELCFKKFIYLAHLKFHKSTVHSNLRYICSICKNGK